jgi:hypothetical protein
MSIEKSSAIRIGFSIPNLDASIGFVGERLTGRIEIGQGVEIFIDGYGLREMAPGEGSVIYLEKYNNKVNVTVWPDIRSGDGRTIQLDKAKEELREQV